MFHLWNFSALGTDHTILPLQRRIDDRTNDLFPQNLITLFHRTIFARILGHFDEKTLSLWDVGHVGSRFFFLKKSGRSMCPMVCFYHTYKDLDASYLFFLFLIFILFLYYFCVKNVQDIISYPICRYFKIKTANVVQKKG